MTTPSTLAAELRAYDELRDSLGSCGDGGCLVKRPVGMHTNGGCKCYRDPIKTQRMMYAGQRLRDRLDALAREGWRPIAEWPNDLSDAFMARVYGHGMPPDFGIGYCHKSGRPVAYDATGEQFDPTHFMTPPPTGDA